MMVSAEWACSLIPLILILLFQGTLFSGFVWWWRDPVTARRSAWRHRARRQWRHSDVTQRVTITSRCHRNLLRPIGGNRQDAFSKSRRSVHKSRWKVVSMETMFVRRVAFVISLEDSGAARHCCIASSVGILWRRDVIASTLANQNKPLQLLLTSATYHSSS